jgi:hypothetical protein
MSARVIVRGVATTLLWLGLSLQARAEVIEITASFTPDPSRPQVNEFKNTTINSGYCANYPTECGRWNIFSIATAMSVNSNHLITARHTNPRQGAMFNMPADWRDVNVTNELLHNSAVVQVRIAGIGGQYRLSRRVQELIGEEMDPYHAHNKLWTNGDWLDAPRPCEIGPASGLDDWSWTFFWKTPVVGVCAKQAAFDIPGLSYESVDFAYELRTPNPLKMAPGTYTGTMQYTVGANADFDMGDVMQPTVSAIQLHFTLTVNHVLAVEIPPGGNEVQLVPAGGWQAWLQQGRKPNRLLRDQTFNIWTSTPFKMQLSCVIDLGNTCGLQDAEGNRVPVNVAVSLPYGLTRNGQSVERQPLRLDGQGTERFEPNLYVARKPGTLHFSVEQDGVRQMLDLGSAKFSGDVTVVWDSEV